MDYTLMIFYDNDGIFQQSGIKLTHLPVCDFCHHSLMSYLSFINPVDECWLCVSANQGYVEIFMLQQCCALVWFKDGSHLVNVR